MVRLRMNPMNIPAATSPPSVQATMSRENQSRTATYAEATAPAMNSTPRYGASLRYSSASAKWIAATPAMASAAPRRVSIAPSLFLVRIVCLLDPFCVCPGLTQRGGAPA
jgi:hypothetical protein